MDPEVLTSTAPTRPLAAVGAASWRGTAWTLAAVLLVFSRSLYELFAYAIDSTLYSHLPLIPLIAAVLMWRDRHRVAGVRNGTAPAIGLIAFATVLLLLRIALARRTAPLPIEDALALSTAAFVLTVWAVVLWGLGVQGTRALLFPLGFLLLTVPVPATLLASVQLLLQHASALAARVLFTVSDTAYLYQNLTFELPGIRIEVAPACSGIHSTLALLIVSLLAGHWFLKSPAHATILALAVLPLAMLRNGTRIYVIGELCVHRGAQMINSPIHRQGGPLFFAASLVPLFALLWLLMRAERRSASRTSLQR